jgi:hypothetical protein
MEVSGQLHILATLISGKIPVTIGKMAALVSELVWTL